MNMCGSLCHTSRRKINWVMAMQVISVHHCQVYTAIKYIQLLSIHTCQVHAHCIVYTAVLCRLLSSLPRKYS